MYGMMKREEEERELKKKKEDGSDGVLMYEDGWMNK